MAEGLNCEDKNWIKNYTVNLLLFDRKKTVFVFNVL